MQASFDEPVRAKGQGFLKPSIEALELQLARQEKLTGSLFGKAAEFTFGKDDSVSIDDLVNGVAEFVRPYEAQACPPCSSGWRPHFSLGGSIPASEGAIRFPFLPAPACSGSSAALRGAAANRKRGLLR